MLSYHYWKLFDATRQHSCVNTCLMTSRARHTPIHCHLRICIQEGSWRQKWTLIYSKGLVVGPNQPWTKVGDKNGHFDSTSSLLNSLYFIPKETRPRYGDPFEIKNMNLSRDTGKGIGGKGNGKGKGKATPTDMNVFDRRCLMLTFSWAKARKECQIRVTSKRETRHFHFRHFILTNVHQVCSIASRSWIFSWLTRQPTNAS